MIINIKQFSMFILALLVIGSAIVMSNTMVHEYGHVSEAANRNISFTLKHPKTFMWAAGVETKLECERFNELPLDSRIQVAHAGFRYELIFDLILSLLLLPLTYFLLRRYWSRNKYVVYGSIFINLFPLILLIISFYFNVISTNGLNDWHATTLDCSMFS